MDTVLITGANGFLAYYLTRLFAPEHKVVATGRGPWRQPYEHPNVSYHELDFTVQEKVEAVFKAHAPSIVVHAGAVSKPDECEANRSFALLSNTTATAYLLQQAAKGQCFFLFLSTDFVFDGRTGMYREDDAPGPVNYYGETKRLAELAVRSYAFNWCIVRTVLVYGPRHGGRHNLVTLLAEKLQKGERYNVFDDQVRTPTYVEDLAGAIVQLVAGRHAGVYHVSGEDSITPYGIGLAVARHLGADASLLTPVTAETYPQPAARPARTGLDLTRIKTVLQFQPTSFADGLVKTIEEKASLV